MTDLLRRCHTNGIREASVYVLSRANLSRNEKELHAVYEAFASLLDSLHELSTNGVLATVRIVGDYNCLPEMPKALLDEMMNLKRNADGININLLTAYDAWDELNFAYSRRGSIKISDLWVTSRVDAVIRSGGTALLSGFLPLQSQYAHIMTTQELFNDLTDDDFENLVRGAVSVSHRLGR